MYSWFKGQLFFCTHNKLAFNLIWTKKVYFKAKVDIFLTFILINFLVRTRKSAETLILGFCAHKDMKKNHSQN